MNLSEAIVVLNRLAHRGLEGWHIVGGRATNADSYDRFYDFEAIAIAEKYQREAAKADPQHLETTVAEQHEFEYGGYKCEVYRFLTEKQWRGGFSPLGNPNTYYGSSIRCPTAEAAETALRQYIDEYEERLKPKPKKPGFLERLLKC